MTEHVGGIELEVERDGRRVVVAVLAGELDHDAVAAVEDRLAGAADDAAVGLVCDLREVRYLDSAALHLLHRLERLLRGRGQRMVAVEPAATTAGKVLRLTGLDGAVPLYDSRAAAVEALASED
ncbi:MAG: STAS domain-containing protein [Solirubrobacterales bacterium]|nr:STAS domain-containing protein [Solirubrobacterales bacterium]